jgi:hypothetical protein
MNIDGLIDGYSVTILGNIYISNISNSVIYRLIVLRGNVWHYAGGNAFWGKNGEMRNWTSEVFRHVCWACLTFLGNVLTKGWSFQDMFTYSFSLPCENYWVVFQQAILLVVLSFLRVVKLSPGFFQVHNRRSIMSTKWLEIQRTRNLWSWLPLIKFLLSARQWIPVTLWIRCYPHHLIDEEAEIWRSVTANRRQKRDSK